MDFIYSDGAAFVGSLDATIYRRQRFGVHLDCVRGGNLQLQVNHILTVARRAPERKSRLVKYGNCTRAVRICGT